MLIRRATAALVAVALLPALAAVAPAQALPERRAPSTVTFTTVGNGHGKGLSQYGARNRAEAGQSWRTIVMHYYPSTNWGKARGAIRVQLTEDTTKDVVVRARSGLRLHSLGAGKTWRLPGKVRGKQVSAWKIRPAGHSSAVSYRTRGWHPWRTARGDAEFSAGGAPVVLLKPGGAAPYRGALRSASVNASGSSRDTVNVLPLDTYLRGVVADEVPASWSANAVRAQAVAARTYASFERRDSRSQPYDLCDTASCQVYGGVLAEHPLADAAVRATARTIVTFGGKPAFAQFTASNGGWSVYGGYPYLRAREDTFDHGIGGDPTKRRFTADQIAGMWPGLGDLQSIQVTARDGHGPFGGRVSTVRVVGSDSTVTATGQQLKDWLGLNETLFRITTS